MVSQAHQKAYRDLIADHADQEPNHGWHDVTDVPDLGNIDQAIVLLANPDIFNEIELDPETVARILADGACGNLGTYVASRITAAVRQWVLSGLQEEASRRNERRYERQVEDYYGGDRCMTTQELIARDCGVGRLFK